MLRLRRLILALFGYSLVRLVLTAIASGIAVIALFLPLTQILGYESAAMFGVVGGLFSLWTTLSDQRVISASKSREFPENHILGDPVLRSIRAFVFNLEIVLFPAIIIAMNGLRVVNCSPEQGALFWCLIPGASVLVGTVGGIVIAELTRRRWLRILLALIFPAASGCDLLLRLALEPPIVGYNLFLGYFAGSLYDEALGIPPGLIVYRLLNICLVATILSALHLRWKIQQYQPFRASAITTCLLVLATTLGYAYRQSFGIDLTTSTIADNLGGRIETQHFVIHYPASGAFDSEVIKQLIEDHEFRYNELRDFFQIDPVATDGEKINSFIYATPEQKWALTGGRRTMVAKIWLNEFHLVWRHYGDDVLTHEMAHLFTRPFAYGPLQLSGRYGFMVNMGLVEGIAMAAEWSAIEFTPHEAAASLRALGHPLQIENLVGATGFWRQSSGVAYSVTGSFIRFLIDTYGIEKLKIAYPNGDFEAAYGQPLSVLINQWYAYLDTIPLSNDDLARARTLFQRRTIFSKVCPRRVGDLELKVEAHMNAGEWNEALKTQNAILSLDPENVENQISYANLLSKIPKGTVEMTSRRVLDKLLKEYQTEDRDSIEKRHFNDSKFTPRDLSSIYSMLGDELWKDGGGTDGVAEDAVYWYKKALAVGVDIQMRRFLEAKIGAKQTTTPETEAFAYNYLVAPKKPLFAEYDLVKWTEMAPNNPYPRYLLARRLAIAKRWDKSLEYLLDLVKDPELFEQLSSTLQDETSLLFVTVSASLRGDTEPTVPPPLLQKQIERLKSSHLSHYREAGDTWSKRYEFFQTSKTPF